MNNLLQRLKNSTEPKLEDFLLETDNMMARDKNEQPVSLCNAVIKGDDHSLHDLLKREFYPNKVDVNGKTPLKDVKREQTDILGEVSKTHTAIQTLDKTISNLEMELATARATQELILNGAPVSENLKEAQIPKKRKYLMVVGINTAFSSRKRRDSVRATWLPQLGEKRKKLEEEKGIVASFVIGHRLWVCSPLKPTYIVCNLQFVPIPLVSKARLGFGFPHHHIKYFLGIYCFGCGKAILSHRDPGPIIRVIQIIVVASRNRRLLLPTNSNELYDVSEEATPEEERIPHTNQFRLLDKAAIPAQVSTMGPWRICTVSQVEEVKILARLLPILASAILGNTCLAQLQTFSVTQGNQMDLHLGHSKSLQPPFQSSPYY